MKKIIQIIEGRTISCLTEDGKVYHWLTYYTDGKERAFETTEKEKFEKIREWVQLEDTAGIKFMTKARQEETKEDNPNAGDVITDAK